MTNEEARHRAAEQLRSNNGSPGSTVKFEIGEYGFYLHTAFFEDRLDFLAITCSGLHEHNIRAMMEVVTRMATRALRRGAYTLEELCQLWRGYEFEPMGICPQLLSYGEESPIVKSPLDAAAKIIQARYLGKKEGE